MEVTLNALRAHPGIGGSNGMGWSWQLDAEPAVSVDPLPLGATELVIAQAFVDSVNDDGPALASAQLSYPPNCFELTFEPTSVLRVGPFSEAPSCQVTGAWYDCTFNPTLIERKYIPWLTGAPQLPALGRVGLVLLTALLL